MLRRLSVDFAVRLCHFASQVLHDYAKFFSMAAIGEMDKTR